ncbi:MAG: Rpp14/Pop5 family protein [Desulfurococcaceae archaeon TW002]
MELLEVVFFLIASVALVLAIATLHQLVLLRRRIKQALISINSRVLKQVIKSIEKRRKHNNRYLVVRLVTQGNTSLNELQKQLNEAFIELYGKKNYSEASPKILYFSEKTSKAVIRVRSHYRWGVLLALAYLERKNLLNQVCPERITGTYKKAKKYAETI